MKTLLDVANLFVKSIEYEIKRDLNKGDDEGANLKEYTRQAVLNIINKESAGVYEIYEDGEPKRFSLDSHSLHGGDDAFMNEDDEGEYVRYSAYKTVRNRIDLLLQKIATVAKEAKLWNGDTQLTGPHCILFLEDFGAMINSQSFTDEEATIAAREIFIESCFSPEVYNAPEFEASRERINAGDFDDMPMLQIAKAALLYGKPIP